MYLLYAILLQDKNPIHRTMKVLTLMGTSNKFYKPLKTYQKRHLKTYQNMAQ